MPRQVVLSRASHSLSVHHNKAQYTANPNAAGGMIRRAAAEVILQWEAVSLSLIHSVLRRTKVLLPALQFASTYFIKKAERATACLMV